MRLFQNLEVYPPYLRGLHASRRGIRDHRAFRDAILEDRYFASHILQPVLRQDEETMLAVGSDAVSQRLWARAAGLPRRASRYDILRAQIEEHRAEIFYNIDPVRFPSDFVRSLPGTVSRSIAWRAAPDRGVDLGAYDLIVSNFPRMLDVYAARGWQTAPFAPAHDPVLDDYAARTDRPIDLLFIGTHSRHHVERARALEAVAALGRRFAVAIHLVESRMSRLANSPLGLVGPLRRIRYSPPIRAAARPPLFGRALYDRLSSAKIVFNGAIDIAGDERGNMRCWETLGSRAALLTDRGSYPAGMVDGETMFTYGSADEIGDAVARLLDDPAARERVATRGHEMIRGRYDKSSNWAAFQALIR